MTEEDVGILGQPVGDLCVTFGKHPVVPREAKTLVVLEEGNVGAWARPFVLEIGSGDERQAAAVIGVVALAGGEDLSTASIDFSWPSFCLAATKSR